MPNAIFFRLEQELVIHGNFYNFFVKTNLISLANNQDRQLKPLK